jgi:SH3-like domain-containing protein
MRGNQFKLFVIGFSVIILSILFNQQGEAAEYLCVQATSAIIRSGPGPSGPVLWKIEKYHPIEVLEKKGDWYRFRDFEGDVGWINKSLLGKTPAVIVKKDKTPIRSKPDSKADSVFSVDKGVPFKVIQKKGQWIEIEHADGDKGWIHESSVWP